MKVSDTKGEDEWQSVRFRGSVLHFDALRLVALREGDRTEKTLATENEGECLIPD